MRKTSLPNGLPIYSLNSADTNIVYREIFENAIYRKHGIQIADGDCLIDIGANTGLFAVFVNSVCKNATVHACEPIPAIFEVLQRNLELCGQLTAKPICCGASNREATATFTYYPRISCASTLHKIDAERSELDILSGIESTDWPKIRQIVIEVHNGPDDARTVEELLRSHQFQTVIKGNPVLPNLSMVYGIKT